MFYAPIETLPVHLMWTEYARAQDRRSSGLFTAAAGYADRIAQRTPFNNGCQVVLEVTSDYEGWHGRVYQW